MPYAQADIAGDVVLVTGATSGIGEACAWRFAEAGCKLVLTGRRAQRLDSLKASIEAKHEGVTVTCVTMDVTDLERVAAQLNAALLSAERQDREAALPVTLRLLQRAQAQLRDHHVRFPALDNEGRPVPRSPGPSELGREPVG